MSTKSKLLEKTLDLQLPGDLGGSPKSGSVDPMPARPEIEGTALMQPPPVTLGAAPRTGPGQMLQFRGQMLAVEGELSKLRDRLKEHDGSLPTRKLDPALVQPGQWANRHPDAFLNADFARLKEDIAAAGGNVQPVVVRPAPGSAGRYEIVFGHRRHRACLELGLPLLATIAIQPLSETELFAAMDRENRERADLSPYEQGMMYRRALDAGLHPSNRRLAEALGVSHTWVSNVLAVADLPGPILECFRSPIEVQHRHAKVLAQALEQDRKAVLRRAEKLRQAGGRLAPGAVVAALTAPKVMKAQEPERIEVGGRAVGSWRRSGEGRIQIQLDGVAESQVEGLLAGITKALE